MSRLKGLKIPFSVRKVWVQVPPRAPNNQNARLYGSTLITGAGPETKARLWPRITCAQRGLRSLYETHLIAMLQINFEFRAYDRPIGSFVSK